MQIKCKIISRYSPNSNPGI